MMKHTHSPFSEQRVGLSPEEDPAMIISKYSSHLVHHFRSVQAYRYPFPHSERSRHMPSESAHVRPLSVVIAEDNPSFRQNLATLVTQQKGYRIAGQAQDGAEVIAMVNKTHPDLVLLDISMPNIGGLAAAFEIRHESPHTKIVFVTIHDKANYYALADMVKVDGYVCKYNLKQELPLLLEKVRSSFAAERV